ncbi:NupC/NupG family nucleoside CNT transporter, partial [Escherichia coli]|nr:NupC/NupG family nucleoside CNT transporter [Escherichia coli]
MYKRQILVGLAIQVLFGFIVLKWNVGRAALEKVTTAVQNVVNYANEGISFLFGTLSDASQPTGFIFAFNVLT